MLQHGNSYENVYRGFRWDVPARFNIGVAACDRHADGTGRLALIYEAPDGRVERFTFDDLKRLSNRCANALAGFGVKAGDRVGVLLPQRPETAIAHLAIYKLGAIAVPLFVQFGPDALEHRLADSGAKVLITDGENLAKISPGLPDLATILIVEGETRGHPLFWPILERARDAFATADTAAEDPALIIYTSGTTGKPKGALHAHRVLLGHLPGVQLPHDFFPQPGDLFWTPADWAWIGGLLDVLLPSLLFRRPGVGAPRPQIRPGGGVRADGAARRAQRLSAADRAEDDARGAAPRERFGLDLRSVASGGEALGEDILDWATRRSASPSTSSTARPRPICWSAIAPRCSRPAGSMGRPIPGHGSPWSSPDGRAAAARRRPASSRSGGPIR